MKPLLGINTRATLVGPAAVGNSAERGARSHPVLRLNCVHPQE